LVSNALKYAFPSEIRRTGEICIELGPVNDSHIRLAVSDNGIGFPTDLDFSQTQTLGLQLVNALAVDELEGPIQLDRRHGTLFAIIFPRQSD
jgi:two-component sensor histidine kinase